MTILSLFKTLRHSNRFLQIDESPSDVQSRLEDMLRIQQRLNIRMDGPDWETKGNPHTRALWVECGELLDHIGWKWWKKQESDLEQIKLELIDILHFGLSITLLQSRSNLELASSRLESKYLSSERITHNTFYPLNAVEYLAGTAITEGNFDAANFFRLAHHFGMSFDEIYSTYVSKSVLNLFRQDNGYKEGTYLKLWTDGKEDNEHLSLIMASIPMTEVGYPEAVERELSRRYKLALSSNRSNG